MTPETPEHPGSGSPPEAGTMLAAVKPGLEPRIELQRVPRPCATADAVVVEVAATGICGTDLHILHNEFRQEPPVVLGHEITGTVDAVGSAEHESWLGRRVAVETYFSTCERCEQCRAGRRNLCADRRSLGSFEDGGFAQWVLVPVINLHELPEGLEHEEGALLEPLACVAHCLLDPPVVGAGDRVLVTGPGTVGLLSAQVAAACGGQVLVAGLEADAGRLAVAEQLGMATTAGQAPADEFDVVLECSGSEGGARHALSAAARRGRYVQVGVFGRDVTLPMDAVFSKELTVTSGFASTPTSWRTALRLLEQNRISLAPLITARIPLPRIDEAFAALEGGEGIKNVVIAQES